MIFAFSTLWLFSEYAEGDDLDTALESVLSVLRPLPIIPQKEKDEREAASKDKKEQETGGDTKSKDQAPPKTVTRTIVLADGTYGTEAVTESSSPADLPGSEVQEEKKTMLKTLLQLGDYLLASCLGVALARMVVRMEQADAPSACAMKLTGEKRNEVLFVCANLVRLLKSAHSATESNDSVLRLHLCIRLLTTPMGKQQALDRVRATWMGSSGKEDLMRVIELEAQNSEWSREKLMDEAHESAQMVSAVSSCIDGCSFC